MLGFLKKILHLNENIKNNETYENEGELFENNLHKEFGNCKKYNPFGIKILFITDTHNCLGYTDKYVNELKTYNDYDICIILGDASAFDLDVIKSIVSNEKIYGIVGNHDSIDKMKESGITDINGKVIECKGIKIAGIMGSCRYKQGDYGMMTHEESMEIAKTMDRADILVSHDKAYIWDKKDNAHDGLKGITWYLYKNHVPIHVHGHLHEEFEEVLKNGTRSIGLYQIKLLEL